MVGWAPLLVGHKIVQVQTNLTEPRRVDEKHLQLVGTGYNWLELLRLEDVVGWAPLLVGHKIVQVQTNLTEPRRVDEKHLQLLHENGTTWPVSGDFNGRTREG